MPTGYTAKLVSEGQTFNEFVLTCARAFGACVMMRDNNPDELPTPDAVATDYSHYESRLSALYSQLKSLLKMTKAEQQVYGETKLKEERERHEQREARRLLENSRIEEMVGFVNLWIPPTQEHQQLKEFMLQQLEVSQTFNYALPLELMSPEEYYRNAVSETRENIRDAQESLTKERERSAARVRWVRELYSSLAKAES
jgi:hypothetical protein